MRFSDELRNSWRRGLFGGVEQRLNRQGTVRRATRAG